MNLRDLYLYPRISRKLGIVCQRVVKRSLTQTVPLRNDRLLQQCYSILEINPPCRDETVIRKAYLEKVKQYHPDATFRNSKADDEKFNEVQQAYETLTELLKSVVPDEILTEQTQDDGSIKFDIRHTAPQHRTHLEYGGYGMGTPSQRQNAYYKMRAEKAHERVYEYRRDRESVETREELVERKKRMNIKSTNFIDRLVEDLIQESMSRGDFNNIRPSGKPLHERNPHYMDFTTYKINEILIDNGYMPEWIQLEKQVRQSIEQARIDLKRTYKIISTEHQSQCDEKKSYLINNPKWIKALDKFRTDISMINVDINKLNLVVPMLWRQQVHYNVEREVDKIVALDPLVIDLPPSEEELSMIRQQEFDQQQKAFSVQQTTQRYSVVDAIRDIIQSLKNFKI